MSRSSAHTDQHTGLDAYERFMFQAAQFMLFWGGAIVGVTSLIALPLVLLALAFGAEPPVRPASWLHEATLFALFAWVGLHIASMARKRPKSVDLVSILTEWQRDERQRRRWRPSHQHCGEGNSCDIRLIPGSSKWAYHYDAQGKVTVIRVDEVRADA